jgi:hypothetical protein
MKTHLHALALVVALAPAGAIGCEYAGDERPWPVKIGQAPIIFVGTVTALADVNGRVLGNPAGKCGDDPLVPCGAAPSVLSADKVVFTVETPIRGVTGGTMLVEQGDGADCGMPYEIGQRWLFAGTFIGGPSVQLDNKSEAEIADLVRQAEEAIR